ncbi:hypothetical protein SCANM63S_08146 [Streptomyces canarius]
MGGAGPHGDLRFAGGEDGGQGGVGVRAGFEVEQDEPVRVLRLRGPHQAPDGRAGQVGDVLPRDADRAVGDDGQRAGVVVLEGGERGAQRLAYGAGVGAGRAVQHPVRGVGGVGVQGQRLPVEGEQGVGGRVTGAAQVRERAGGERGDRGDGGAGGVGQVDGEGVVPGGHQPGPQHGGADGVQGDAGERERQPGGVVGGAVAEQGQGVQGGVEGGRVQAEAGRVGGGPLGQPYLGVEFLAAPPGGGQGLEGGPVRQSGGGVPLVQAVRVEGFGVLGGPDVQAAARRTGVRGEEAGGVQGPRLVGGQALGAGVHLHRAGAGGVGCPDGDLDAHAVVGGQHQRYFEGEFLQVSAADLVAGADGEFDHGGAGDDDRAADDVVGEPGVGAHRQPAGEHGAVGVGEHGGRAEQRVVGGVQAGGADVADGCGGPGPEPLALEGGGGQVDGAGAGEQRGPVHGGPAGVELGHGGEQGLGLVALAAGGGGEHGVGAGAVDGQALAGHGRQHGVRAEFEEAGDALGGEGAYPVVEADRLAHVPHPVAGAGDVLGGEGAGDVGDDRDGGPVIGQGLGDRPEPVQHRFHERRVEGVRDRQTAALGEAGGHRLGLGGVPGDHHGLGAVDGGDADPLGEQRADLLLGGAQGDHRAALGQRLHEPAARGHQCGRVLQVQDAGHVGGGDLADGVPGQVVGREPPGLHQPVQRDLEGEQRHLGAGGAVERCGVVTEDEIAQFVVAEERADLVEGAGEDGEVRVQLPAHAGALGALPGEQEGGLSLADPARGGARTAVGDPGHARQERVPVRAEDHGPVRVGGAGGGQGVRHVHRVRLTGGGHQAGGLFAQGALGAAGDHPRHQRRCRTRLGPGRFPGGGFFQDGVRVGAAGAEGGDGGAARAAGVGPGQVLRQQPHLALDPVDPGGRLVGVQRLRQDAVPHRHDGLDDAGDTGRGLGVPDVGLHRPEPQRAACGPVLSVGGEQRLGLDRVA